MAIPFRSIWKETDEYVFTTGDHHTLVEQVEFNNVALQEYYVDMTLDLKRFEAIWITQHGLISSLSLYMHTREGALVGTSRTAVRGNRAWLAGIGLVPSFRGRGLGPLLFTEYMNLLRTESAIEHLQFECIKQNARALKMYQNFGCVVDGALIYHHIKVDGDSTAGNLEIAGETARIDLGLPWLQHITQYSWQREYSVMLNGIHRQYIFKRASSDALELAVAVEVKRDPPRINGIAYHNRPEQDVLVNCLRRLAVKLGVTEFVFANEPEASDITPVLDAVGRRDDLAQVHLTRAIERA